MKHTLQSLLMTTVLTLPTVFGGTLDLPVDPATVTTQSSIVELSKHAFDLTQMGRPAAAARLYLKSLNHDSRLSDVTFVVGELEKLGYPNLAIQAYKVSMKLPNTQIYSNAADTEIARLEQLPSQRPQSTLDRFPWGTVQKLSGEVAKDLSKEVAEQLSECASQNSMDIIALGFLDQKDVYRLAQVSTKWRIVAKPMLDKLNAWRLSNVIPRLLEGFPLTFENHSILAFLGINTDASFDNVLKAAFAVKSWTMPMPADEHTALVDAINNHPIFYHGDKEVLNGIVPNAIPNDILKAAKVLPRRGPAYYERAAKLYDLLANRDGAPSRDIQLAADGLLRMGPAYHPRAEALYERSVNHPDATPKYIRWAAKRLDALGSQYHDKAAARYEQSANHPNSEPYDIREAAYGLRILGSKLHQGSAECNDYQNRAAALRRKLGF
jgi:hypothetical protein